jgi:ArpU family phage transcriptional regulator
VKLLPTVNKKETETNVKQFLSGDFQRLIVKAGYSKFQLKSPGFSDMPKAASIGNPLEENLVKHVDADNTVRAAVNAINRCPERYRVILQLAYIQDLTDEMIIAQIPYERSRYYDLKTNACLWFADAFELYIDLHAYK